MTGTLDGRVAIVTGAGQGMGRSFAQTLADAGATVAVVEVVPGRGQQAVDELRAEGRDAIPYELDVRDRPAIEAMVADLEPSASAASTSS